MALALWWLGNAGYIHAKAWLGQVLIERAWKKTQQTQTAVKPWPWADTVPVARLSARWQDKQQGMQQSEQTLILRGANGRTIAWGPGWREGSAPLGAERNGNNAGNSVVIAHRDTHFRFLKDMAVGDMLELENVQGKILRYRVWRTRIVDANFALPIETEDARLTLVTCYPFDALTRDNQQRYLVEAVREE